MRRKKLSRRRRTERSVKRGVITVLNARAFSGLIGDPRWVIGSSKYAKTDIAVFYDKFAAALFIDLLIGEDEIEWVNDNEIKTSTDVHIRDSKLKEIFKHRLTAEERQFELGEDYQRRALYIRSDQKYVPPPPKEEKARHSRKGMILVAILAKEAGMNSREARSILRRSKIKKPKHGWAWNNIEEAKEIRELFAEHKKGGQSS